MDKFALDLLASSREIPKTLVALTVSHDSVLADRARDAFLRMEDTIIKPVALAGGEFGVTDRLWLTNVAVDAEVRLRRDLAVALEKMLVDRTLLPEVAPPGMAEESAPPKRVCDEAYLQLRALLDKEGSNAGVLNRDRFLQEIFEERDKEIKKFQTSREFTNFMDESAMEEE